MFTDLILNIFAEIFGIVITVFWIDRLLRRREKEQEEKRWLPAKHLIYYDLAFALWSLLVWLKPNEERNAKINFYYVFGERHVFCPFLFSEVIQVPAKEYVSNIIKHFDDNAYELVMNRDESVESILDVHAQLIEPELLPLLMEFKSTARSVVKTYKRYVIEKQDSLYPVGDPRRDEYVRQTLGSNLERLINATYFLLGWLDKHATAKMTSEEHKNRYPDK